MITVCTYNISVDKEDVCPVSGQIGGLFSWSKRKAGVLSLVEQVRTMSEKVVIFLQEVSEDQITDIGRLFPEEKYLMLYKRSDSRDWDQHLVVIVSRNLLGSGSYKPVAFSFLDEVRVLGIDTGDKVFLGTHFPTHEQGRLGWTVQLNNHLPVYVEDKTVILGGDFNAYSDEDGPRLMKTICDICELENATRDGDNNSRMRDMNGELLSNTFWGFPGKPWAGRISPYNLDHILHTPDLQMVSPARVLRSRYVVVNGTDYDPSDHFPVIVHYESY